MHADRGPHQQKGAGACQGMSTHLLGLSIAYQDNLFIFKDTLECILQLHSVVGKQFGPASWMSEIICKILNSYFLCKTSLLRIFSSSVPWSLFHGVLVVSFLQGVHHILSTSHKLLSKVRGRFEHRMRCTLDRIIHYFKNASSNLTKIMNDLQWVRDRTSSDDTQLPNTKETFSTTQCRIDHTRRNLYTLLYAMDVFCGIRKSLCDFVQNK